MGTLFNRVMTSPGRRPTFRRRPLSYGPYHHPRIDPKLLFQRVGQGLQGEA